jgi:hypothetical protein
MSCNQIRLIFMLHLHPAGAYNLLAHSSPASLSGHRCSQYAAFEASLVCLQCFATIDPAEQDDTTAEAHAAGEDIQVNTA